MLKKKKLAILGAGKIGETLIKGLLEAGAVAPQNVVVTAAHPERVADLERRLGVGGASSNEAAAAGADVVTIAVKPKVVGPLARARTHPNPSARPPGGLAHWRTARERAQGPGRA